MSHVVRQVTTVTNIKQDIVLNQITKTSKTTEKVVPEHVPRDTVIVELKGFNVIPNVVTYYVVHVALALLFITQ